MKKFDISGLIFIVTAVLIMDTSNNWLGQFLFILGLLLWALKDYKKNTKMFVIQLIIILTFSLILIERLI